MLPSFACSEISPELDDAVDWSLAVLALIYREKQNTAFSMRFPVTNHISNSPCRTRPVVDLLRCPFYPRRLIQEQPKSSKGHS
jgi:hypothetical protein